MKKFFFVLFCFNTRCDLLPMTFIIFGFLFLLVQLPIFYLTSLSHVPVNIIERKVQFMNSQCPEE